MNEEYIYVKTDAVQKDMHDFVNQFGDEISSLSYVGNTIKLKNGVVYRFTYNTIGIRKYYTYTEIYNHHLEFKFNKLQKENKQLKGSLQTYEILLKANVEENQQLKERLQQKEDVINKIIKKCNKEKGRTDFDIFINLNEQLKTLENFSKKIDYNLHPIITEAYKCDIRNSINDLCNTIRYDVIYKDDVLEILEKSDK